MERIDLHVHSNASDGSLTPTEVADEAMRMGLSAIALTDHDTVDGVAEILDYTKDKHLEVVPGIELSCYYNNREIHILGFYMDYENPELQKELQQMIKSKLTAVQRMEVSESLIGDNDIVRTVLNGDIDLIRETYEKTSREDFAKAVSTINKARKIYILGVRSSAALASFLGFYFNLVFDSVELIDTSSAAEMFEQIFRIDKEDVCIAISFPRYSKQTVNAIRFVSDRGAKIVAITDSDTSPIASYADCLLVARSDMASVVDSLVAPLSLINALIVAVTLSKREEVINNFNKLESIWAEYQVYEKAEDISENE